MIFRLSLLTILALVAIGAIAGIVAAGLLRALALHVGGPDRRAA